MRPHPPWMAAARRLPALFAIVTAAGGLAGAPATAQGAARSVAAAAKHVRPLLGVNVGNVGTGSPSGIDAEIRDAAALHATVVRSELPWSLMQPSARGMFDPRALAFLDRMIADARARHIRVILLVDSSPCWDSSAPEALLRECASENSSANGWPPRDPDAFAEFVAFLAARYGPSLAAIEIWNEPDHVNERYFAGPEKARHYAELLHLAYPAIKHANPNVAVIAGSLVGFNGVFLRALYANGIKGYYDGLAVHYYSLTLDALRTIRKVQRENGDSTPLWLDEFGWTSCYPKRIQEEQSCVTKAVQAANLRNILRAVARDRYVAAEVTYRLRDTSEGNFGVIAHNGARKRSFAWMKSAFISPFGPVARMQLRLRRHGRHLVASGSGPVGDVVELEASGGGLRFLARFALNRFNRFALALPAVLGTRGVIARVFQPSAGRHAGATATT